MKSLYKHMRAKAIAGILLILPVGITLFALQFFFKVTEGIFCSTDRQNLESSFSAGDHNPRTGPSVLSHSNLCGRNYRYQRCRQGIRVFHGTVFHFYPSGEKHLLSSQAANHCPGSGEKRNISSDSFCRIPESWFLYDRFHDK